MRGKKILVIDDDALVRKSIENVLKTEEYEVTLADDGFMAVEALKHDMFDLIISDIRMPGKNGVETIKEIRDLVNKTSPRDIPIIFVTGYASMSDELNAEGLGEVILKPFDLDRLLITVREYL